MSGLPTVQAAGAVLWRDDGPAGLRVAVVHRPRYDDWSHPKGKLAPGEHPLAGAVREVLEETGFHGVVGRSLGSAAYRVSARGGTADKVVRYWSMCAAGGAFLPGDEVDELRWLPPAAARSLLTQRHDVDLLARLLAAPVRTTTVLLVRHARAGSKSGWAGDDRLRPLDPAGLAQAALVARVAPLFGPERVLSADLERCEQTVRPLADLLGVPVELDPGLSERSNVDDPGRAARRLRQLAAAGRHVAVCSQGGVIPASIRELTSADGVAVEAVAARKGSIWVLSFAPGAPAGQWPAADGRGGPPALVGADYLPTLTP